MYEYNYQRMQEERREQYERRLPHDPVEQAVLAERVNYLRRNAHLFNRMKQLISDECIVPGTDERPVYALVESPEMEEFLNKFQEKVFAMAVKAGRISELERKAPAFAGAIPVSGDQTA
ncbi:hypothetical protein [Brenneria corticis]|uniref:Uncharacterized protein n=1 Tax=Brenneria corticis TaxID=2173106 RepID=A0A2U1TMB6_9GAMM|nr:hypothetical protein [Brenneria sp. CFCC 11842]PWC10509.1 hypothetical protein DDT56_21590 [Brenneria sp. CFCC 11842]